jgi:hypothetical protein
VPAGLCGFTMAKAPLTKAEMSTSLPYAILLGENKRQKLKYLNNKSALQLTSFVSFTSLKTIFTCVSKKRLGNLQL